MEPNELYIVTPFFINDFTTDCPHPPLGDDGNGWELNFRTNSYPLTINQAIELNYECEREEEEAPWECEYYFENEYAVYGLAIFTIIFFIFLKNFEKVGSSSFKLNNLILRINEITFCLMYSSGSSTSSSRLHSGLSIKKCM